MRVCSQPCLLVATKTDMTFWSHRAFMLDDVCLPYSIAIVTIHGSHVYFCVSVSENLLDCNTLAFFEV